MADTGNSRPNQRYCIYCGAELRSGNAFCVSCGTRLSAPSGSQDEARPSSSNEVDRGEATSTGQGMGGSSYDTLGGKLQGLTQKLKSLPQWGKLAMGVGATLILVLIIAGSVTGNSNSSSSSGASASSSSRNDDYMILNDDVATSIISSSTPGISDMTVRLATLNVEAYSSDFDPLDANLDDQLEYAYEPIDGGSINVYDIVTGERMYFCAWANTLQGRVTMRNASLNDRIQRTGNLDDEQYEVIKEVLRDDDIPTSVHCHDYIE